MEGNTRETIDGMLCLIPFLLFFGVHLWVRWQRLPPREEPATAPAHHHQGGGLLSWVGNLGAKTETAQEVLQQQQVGPPPMSAREWVTLLNHQPDRVPHLLLVGATGSGKTTLCRALLAGRGGDCVVFSAKLDDSAWGPLPFVSYDADGECSELLATLRALLQHLRTRTADEVPLTVVIDDYPILATERELKESITDLLTRAARVGRSKRLRLVVLSQETTARAMSTNGQTAVLQNFARVDVRNRRATLQLPGDGTPRQIDTRQVPVLAARPLPLRPWVVPVEVPVPTDMGADFWGNTGDGTRTVNGVLPDADAVPDEYADVPEKRAAIIRKASAAGLSRKDIAYLMGGNHTQSYTTVKRVLDAE